MAGTEQVPFYADLSNLFWSYIMNTVKNAVDAVMQTLSQLGRGLTDDQVREVLEDLRDEIDSRLVVYDDEDYAELDDEDDRFDVYREDCD